MPDQPSAVSGAFRRPFREQVAFFRQKLGNRVPTRRWDDLTGEAHDTAFMVAGAQKADLLADLGASIDRAITEGKSLDAFRQDFRAAVARHDWHGWTGEDTKGGTAWRTRTIYRTNTYVSYAAGRRAQLQAGDWAFWIYRHGGSRDPRPEHLFVFNGLVLPPGHPFWVKHYPPSDWGCSCYVLGARSERGARRLGGDPSRTLPAGWDKNDPKTGEPLGVGKGWGYAPGASVAGPVAAIAGKIGAWDYQIAKAFMGEMPPTARDAIADAYRRSPSVEDDLRRFAQQTLADRPDRGPLVRTMGVLTTADAKHVEAVTGVAVDGYDFSIDRAAINHVDAEHGPGNETDRKQRPVEPADFAQLPAVVAAPDAVSQVGTSIINSLPIVEYRRVIDGEEYVARFELRGAKRRTLALKTFFVKR